MLFHIQNMTCAGCARSVTMAIRPVDKDAVVTADPESHRVEVRTSAARTRIEAALDDAGYPASAA